MAELVEHVLNNEKLLSGMRNAPRLYGSCVSESIVKEIKRLFDEGDQFFYWATERLGIYKEENFPDYL